jgi:type II secretory pathway component PulC
LSSNFSNAKSPEPMITRGLIIDKVEKGSPYDKVGLKVGDEVLSFDRTSLKSPKDAMSFYNSAKVGKVKVMLVVRNGVRQNIHINK